MLRYEDVILYCAKHGYSRRYAIYWATHLCCQVCGRDSEPPHHVRTRGAGGTDDASNLLALCVFHHRMIHTAGPSRFCADYPAVEGKVRKALSAPRVTA